MKSGEDAKKRMLPLTEVIMTLLLPTLKNTVVQASLKYNYNEENLYGTEEKAENG